MGGSAVRLGGGEGWEGGCLGSVWCGEFGICDVGICWTRVGKRVTGRWCYIVDVTGAVWCYWSFDQVDEGWRWC